MRTGMFADHSLENKHKVGMKDIKAAPGEGVTGGLMIDMVLMTTGPNPYTYSHWSFFLCRAFDVNVHVC